MNYTQEELNEIIMSKPLGEFYIAMLENRGEPLTDSEYEKLTKREIVFNDDAKENIDSIVEYFQSKEDLKDAIPNVMKMIYGFVQIRHMAVLTVIDGKIYDIANMEFVDFKRNKIVHYDNLTNYFNDANARIKIFTSNDSPELIEPTALLDIDDESIMYTYEENHSRPTEEDDDLTSSFLDEIKGKARNLSK